MQCLTIDTVLTRSFYFIIQPFHSFITIGHRFFFIIVYINTEPSVRPLRFSFDSLHGEGDRTHTTWEHVANSPHKIHGAYFADVDCSESVELKEAHRAGEQGWPMIKYFNWHTGLEGRMYHPPSHQTDHLMRTFILEVIREAHTESRRKHHAHMEHKHGSKGRKQRNNNMEL